MRNLQITDGRVTQFKLYLNFAQDLYRPFQLLHHSSRPPRWTKIYFPPLEEDLEREDEDEFDLEPERELLDEELEPKEELPVRFGALELRETMVFTLF